MSLVASTTVAPAAGYSHTNVREMVILCGDDIFCKPWSALEWDFTNFNTLFKEDRPHKLSPAFAIGWKIMLGGLNVAIDENSEALQQLKECARISGSKFWTYVLSHLDSSVERAMSELDLNNRDPIGLRLYKPLQPEIVKRLVSGTRHYGVIDLKMHESSTLTLGWFEGCLKLQQLDLSHESFIRNNRLNRVIGFNSPQTLSQLGSVTLCNGFLQVGVLASLCALPALKSLTLMGTTLQAGEHLAPLLSCKRLSHLRLDAVRFEDEQRYLKYPDGRHANQVQGYLHLLQKELVGTQVRPQVTLPDYTDFSQVLTTQVSYTSFGPDEAEKPTNEDLGKILDSNTQHTFWPKDQIRSQTLKEAYDFECFVSYDHNRINLPFAFGGSPIKCLDIRSRFAIAEPRGTTVPKFWAAVLALKVSLIVMVKNIESLTHYFPQEEKGKVSFTGPAGEPIEVICTCIQKLDHGMTVRTFMVNGKEVKHLQKNIADGNGMSVNELLAFLRVIEEVEGKTATCTTMVHCLQGCGRTGLTFASLIVLQLMRQRKKDQPVRLDLDKLLSGLRQQRESEVLTEDQLRTILRLFSKLHYNIT